MALSGARFIGPLPTFTEAPARPMPERAVRFAAAGGIEGAVFNEYRFGGFLMFRLYPREVAFMDGRNDLYGAWRLRTYVPLLAALPGWPDAWRQAVGRYGVTWALLDESTPMAARLAREPGWIHVAPDPSGVTDGQAGRDGIVLFLADSERHRDDVPQVVFSCANPVVNGVVHVFYGGGDHVIGLATCTIESLVDYALYG